MISFNDDESTVDPSIVQIESKNYLDADDYWRQQRIGKFTASCMYKLMKRGKAKNALWSQTALTYLYEIAAERLSGRAHVEPSSACYSLG